MSLPLPDSDALAASHALQQEIASTIEKAGGAIPFSRFMELALYAPRLGYYSGGAAKLGSSGDFTTAPEITPLFGAALARAAAAIIAQSAPNIIEFGAGTGKLARDVLTALADDGVEVARYTIIELSGELRARQQEALKDFPQVEWRDGFPDAFNGVVLANEVLDAMPVELVIKTANGWRRQMVTVEEGRFAYDNIRKVIYLAVSTGAAEIILFILSTLSGNLANVSLSNDSALLDLKKTDMGAAAIELTGYQTAMQATYKAYAKVGTISLFDLL